jgi:hypothetical protein
MWATSVILINCPKKTIRPMGENSPNRVTLVIVARVQPSLVAVPAKAFKSNFLLRPLMQRKFGLWQQHSTAIRKNVALRSRH